MLESFRLPVGLRSAPAFQRSWQPLWPVRWAIREECRLHLLAFKHLGLGL
jgi:hypothetical protein